MGRFQVVIPHTVAGTDITVYVTSMTQARLEETRTVEDDEEQQRIYAQIVLENLWENAECTQPLFPDVDSMKRELSPHQIADVTKAVLRASGADQGARFRWGDGEAEGASPASDGGKVRATAE